MTEKLPKFTSIISRHSTWMAVNSIQGCPNECMYCFMRLDNLTHAKPQILFSALETVKMVRNSKYYTTDVPICYFPHTDIMTTRSNREYLSELIDNIMDTDLFNPVILVTKCFIPDETIKKLRKLQDSGRRVVVYVSYSGLDNSIENGINNKYALLNFENLKKNDIKTIHYFRPLLPQNSSEEVIKEVIRYVSRYAEASVVTGLKVYKGLEDKYTFWKEIEKIDMAYKYECIWPKNVDRYLKKVSDLYQYPIYQSNSCALELVLKGYDKYGIFNTCICNNFNSCPHVMRERCIAHYEKKQDIDIESQFKRLGYEMVSYEVKGDMLWVNYPTLTNDDICFLSSIIGKKVSNHNNNGDNEYWNNALNGSKQLFI